MPMSEADLLLLQMDAAWETFCDADPNMSTAHLEKIEPEVVSLLKLAFGSGYTAGARSVYRSAEK